MTPRIPLALVAAATATLVAPAAAGAVQSTTTAYQCKYPLVGVRTLDVTISADLPDGWPVAEPTPELPIAMALPALDVLAGSSAARVRGDATLPLSLQTAQGLELPLPTRLTFPEIDLGAARVSSEFRGTGAAPPVSVDDPGTGVLTLERFALNLAAVDAAGDPLTLPPVTKDLDGNLVTDSDGDPSTFDVYCKLASEFATPIGSIEFGVGGPPTPSPTPGAPTPTPSPSPTPTSVTDAAGQCKWPLTGIHPAELNLEAYHRNQPLAGWPSGGAHSFNYLGLKAALTSAFGPSGLIESPFSGTVEGIVRVDLQVTGPDGSSVSVPWKLPVPRTSYSELDRTLRLATDGITQYSLSGLEPRSGHYTYRLDGLGLNLTYRDESGDIVQLPRLTKDVNGDPISDSDGDPDTADVSCAIDAGSRGQIVDEYDAVVEPTPPPSPSPSPTPTPPPATPFDDSYTRRPTAPTVSPDATDADIGARELTVRWGPSSSTGPLGLLGYEVRIDGRVLKVSSNASQVTVTGLAPDTAYEASVVGYTAYAGSLPLVLNFRTKAEATPTPTVTPTPTPGGGPTAKFSYALQGQATLNTLTKGSMPLTGAIDAVLDVATGNYTAQTVINDTQGRLTALGFLPVTVAVAIIPSGATTGQLVDDQLTANLKARIKVKSAKVFGAIPLFTENTCQSKQLSDIKLKSTGPFDPTGAGGTIGGSFAISDLNGCGLLTGILSPLTAGGGNTITAKLTPKS